VRFAAERFQRAICAHKFPKLGEQAPGTVKISGGLASYPWDGSTPAQLVQLADECLLESKRKGKNAITFGQGAMEQCNLTAEPRA
jgi:GGDEF domain-containing protein